MLSNCFLLIRVKDRDEETEPEKLELIQEPDEIKHPSLTVKFTFPVSLFDSID